MGLSDPAVSPAPLAPRLLPWVAVDHQAWMLSPDGATHFATLSIHQYPLHDPKGAAYGWDVLVHKHPVSSARGAAESLDEARAAAEAYAYDEWQARRAGR